MRNLSNIANSQHRKGLLSFGITASFIIGLILAIGLGIFIFKGQMAKAATPATIPQITGQQKSQPHTNNTITPTAELIPPPDLTNEYCYYGNAISLSGDGSTAFVSGSDCNKIIVFTKSGSSWVQAASFTSTDNFGATYDTIALCASYDGSTILIGVEGKNNYAGAVYVFTKNGTNWSQSAELTVSDGKRYFGSAVSLSSDGSTALIAATGYNDTGVVYVFTNNDTGWSQSAKLTNADRTGGDLFGYSVSISGDGSTAIIGAIDHNVGLVGQAGAAYVFTKSGTNWNQSSELIANDPNQYDHFGSAVSIADDESTAVVGSPWHTLSNSGGGGVAYIFTKNNITWSQNAELTNNEHYILTGSTVAISGDGATVVIGTNTLGSNAGGGGAAFVFSKSNNVWNEKAELLSSDKSVGDPASLSKDGSTELIGSAGDAYIYYSNTMSVCQPGATANPSTPIITTYTYYLPFLACNSNNFTTYLAFQNTSSTPATITLQYFNSNGGTITTPSGTCNTLAPFAECIAPNPFVNGAQGTGILISSQPLNVIVSEATPYGGSAYAVSQGASNNQIAPVIIRGGLGDFTTKLTIFNGGNSSVAGTVQFYQQDGTLISAATKNFTLNADTSISYDQASDTNLGNNFYGWAQITSPSGSQLVAQVLEQSPSQHFVALANAQATTQSNLYAPAIFRDAYGAFNTGVNIVNPNAQAVNVTVTYYNKDGSTYIAPAIQLAAHALLGIYQGGASGNGLPAGGLIDNFAGAAVVTSSGGGVVMVVNEFGGVNANGNAKSGTYSASAASSNNVGLPVIANGGYGYTTGATIFNTSGQIINGSIQYYNTDGTTQGVAKTFSVGAHQSVALFQGDSSQGLPSGNNGFYGTAIVTESGGNDLIITTNAASSAFFYSYTEPNS